MKQCQIEVLKIRYQNRNSTLKPCYNSCNHFTIGIRPLSSGLILPHLICEWSERVCSCFLVAIKLAIARKQAYITLSYLFGDADQNVAYQARILTRIRSFVMWPQTQKNAWVFSLVLQLNRMDPSELASD